MTRDIILAIDIDADPKSIFDAITTQEGLAGFWTSDVTASSEVGGALRFGFEPAPTDLLMTLDVAEPGERIVWGVGDAWPHWVGTEVRWGFRESPSGAGTQVVLVHSGWGEDAAEGDIGMVAFTWSGVLGALKPYVETGTPAPFFA